MKWISARRPPKKHQSVIVRTKKEVLRRTCKYLHGRGIWVYCGETHYTGTVYGIIEWMPLPEPPKHQ